MKHLFKKEGGENLSELVRERLQILFNPYTLDFDHEINLDLCFAGLSELKPGDSAKVIKTWLNGWVTSHRMHEPVLHDCLLGCVGKPDDLRHYVQCPHMYALIKYFIADTSDYPLARLGLTNPHASCLKCVCCTFSAYHAVKGQIRSGH